MAGVSVIPTVAQGLPRSDRLVHGTATVPWGPADARGQQKLRANLYDGSPETAARAGSLLSRFAPNPYAWSGPLSPGIVAVGAEGTKLSEFRGLRYLDH